MQVANALNNHIRILFNPKMEAFKLFDFLIVKSDENQYLAQIIEIYEDKFDASQNVAKLKLFYKLSENFEVLPYDNFTPSKECEIVKIKQEEVENFINQNKETFSFAKSIKGSGYLNLQYEFFDENPLILADKIENSNTISHNLAKNLSAKKHVVIIDSTGIMDFKDAKKIKASINFKMPFDCSTIDYIFDKCLPDASLEFQAIGCEILNEIKKFTKLQKDSFIPFNTFVKVLLEQYRATPYPELRLLIARVQKFQMSDVFACNKKDKESLTKAIEKNNITIVDLSNVEASWQKAYVDYIISAIEEEIYLITRINDENFDVDLINKIYSQKSNISFIPTVSYNYKKLPTITQYCKNYILMPSLNQRSDFLDANFALCNLIADGCIIFGKNTNNFLYQAHDIEPEVEEERRIYKKINLTISKENNFQFENLDLKDAQPDENTAEKEAEPTEQPDQNDEFDALVDESKKSEKKQELIEEADEFQNIVNSQSIPVELNNETNEDIIDTDTKENLQTQTNSIDTFERPKSCIDDDQDLIELESFEAPKSTQDDQIELETEESVDITAQELIIDEPEETETISQQDIQQKNNMDLSDEQLDFFEDSDSNALEIKDDDINLSEVAKKSIDKSFEDILNSTSTPAEEIEETTNEPIPEDNLPVYKEQFSKQNSEQNYETGNLVSHAKYGKGTITKVIQYEQRQLLQIEFENSGKKLLDPQVANIKTIN